QETLIKGELADLRTKIDKLQDEYPNLQTFITEQLRGELLAIEADTYAELVKSGRLNKELASMLEDVLPNNQTEA
ncbi:MAG: sodium:proton antiporter, partial [Nostoc sp.]